jgi:uncharacterized membrane protein (TIGR02234 family)
VTVAARAGRGRWAAAVLLLAAATGACSLPVWVRATGVSALAGQVALRVSGAGAAPAVPAAALVLAAAGAAVALAGRVGRWVVAAVVLVAGFVVVVAAVAVLADPSGPAIAAAAAQTGVDHLAGAAGVTAGPWVALVLGVATAVAGVALARASAAWPAPSRRHEVAGPAAVPGTAPDAEPDAGPDERADWDALSRGTDPSEGPGGPGSR